MADLTSYAAGLLSNVHWWLPAFVAAVGVVLFAAANRRAEVRLRSAGLLLVAVAVALGVARYLIDTDQEKMERRTREIVACADHQDWVKMQTLLDPETYLDLAGKGPVPSAKGGLAIAEAADEGSKLVGLKSVAITSLKSDQTDTLIKVTFTAFSTQNGTLDRPYPSSWEFDWQQRGKDWFLQDIKMLSLGNEAVGRCAVMRDA